MAEDGSGLEGRKVGDVLGEIAETRRAEVISSVTAKQTPSFLERIDRSEVVYTIHPASLPYRIMDFEKFKDRLRELYGLEYEEYPAIAADMGALQRLITRVAPYKH